MFLSSLFFGILGVHSAFTTALEYGRRENSLEHFFKSDVLDGSFQKRTLQQVTKVNLTGVDLPKTEWVSLPLDHKNPSAGSFNNRYWVNTEYYKPGGPVFLFDQGEGKVFDRYVAELIDKEGFAVPIMRQFNGIGIVWEHRFYGDSIPSGLTIDSDTPAESMKYLTTGQALADVPAFAWNFTRPNLPDEDLTPAGSPWIFIGGSYPGMRAAFGRHLYPETFFAAWASSAPVQASVDMSFYHEPIWHGMQANNLGDCAADVHAAILEIDNVLDDPQRAPALKSKLFGPDCGSPKNSDIASALATVFDGWQNYGITPKLQSFCDWISMDPATNETSDANGWAAAKGANFTINRWASWPKWNRDCKPDTHIDPERDDAAGVSWQWQYCTEWGFFQSANLGEHQIISKFNSLESWKDDCHNAFEGGVESGLMPEWPRVEETNANYGGWSIRPSNTFWTGGEMDPWRTLSPLSDMSFSPKNVPVQDIPDCGKRDDDESSPIFGYLLSNAEHCYDQIESEDVGEPARALFTKALTKWLGCYSPNYERRQLAYSGSRITRGMH